MSPRRLAAVPESPRRGIGLIRVSKARGREDLISPELQTRAIVDYAGRAGIVIEQWREALDESASADRSPWWRTLEEVVGLVEAGEVDVVVVWKYSRAARHRRRWAVAIDRIEVAGGQLESATEGLDTTTSTGRLGRGMLAEFAAWESEVKGEQWKETHARRRSLGLPHGGQARFGYRYDRATGYTPDPDTGPILTDMYRRYLAGAGHTTIAKWLNRSGVPTVRAAATGWSVQAVIRLMDAGFAAGLIHQASDHTFHQGAHLPLIDADMWEQYRTTRQLRWAVPARVREPAYPLTGLVECGECHRAMVVASDQRYGPGYVYRCTSRISSGTCQGPFVTRAQLEGRVLEWLQELVGEIDVRTAGKAARRAAAATLRLDVTAMERERLKVAAALDRARRYLLDETLTRAEYLEEKDRLEVQAAELEKSLREARAELGWLTGPAVATAQGLLRDWPTLPVKAKRDMLGSLVRKVVVTRGVRGAQGVRVWPLWEPVGE